MPLDLQPLASTLPGRRWFGFSEPVETISVHDEATLHEGPPRLVLTLAEVVLRGGRRALYQLPVLVDEDGSVRDAFEEPEHLRHLGEALAHGTTLRGFRGAFRFGGPGLDPLSPPGERSLRVVGAEQSNSSVVLDESVILKLFRRVEPGHNPEVELGRFLTNAAFEHIPAQLGEIFYEDDELGNVDLAVAQQFVPEATEGWERTLGDLRALLDRPPGDPPQEDDVLAPMEELGDVTALMHVVLARGDELEPDIGSEPVTPADLKAWAEQAEESLERLLDAGIAELAALAGAVRERIGALRELQDPGLKIRIHGDYHLGQTLYVPDKGWLVLDFEGEPLRPLEERRARQSPLRDVAGMLRSFSYAAHTALLERAEPDTPAWDELEAAARAWEEQARDRFLTAYLRTAHEGEFLPRDREDIAVLLDAFEIAKALYEINYELSHRPSWVGIPLAGIREVLERGGR